MLSWVSSIPKSANFLCRKWQKTSVKYVTMLFLCCWFIESSSVCMPLKLKRQLTLISIFEVKFELFRASGKKIAFKEGSSKLYL